MTDDSVTYETIQVSREGRVGIIRLHRPHALNALNTSLSEEVLHAAQKFDADEGVGAIVLRGSEKAFAAGADITELASHSFRDIYMQGLFAAWKGFTSLRTPTVAAVSGYALGGGCELAMMCDIIIAADSAKFGLPEANLGLIPGMGGTQRLTRAVGKAKAMELILTGRTMGAEEAERAGLVARVTPAAELFDDALKSAHTIASKSLPAIYAAKEAVDVAFETNLSEGLRFERSAFQSLFALDDHTEGMAAFAEKRETRFKHR